MCPASRATSSGECPDCPGFYKLRGMLSWTIQTTVPAYLECSAHCYHGIARIFTVVGKYLGWYDKKYIVVVSCRLLCLEVFSCCLMDSFLHSGEEMTITVPDLRPATDYHIRWAWRERVSQEMEPVVEMMGNGLLPRPSCPFPNSSLVWNYLKDKRKNGKVVGLEDRRWGIELAQCILFSILYPVLCLLGNTSGTFFL